MVRLLATLEEIHPTIVRYAGLLIALKAGLLDHDPTPSTWLAAAGMFGYKTIYLAAKNGGKE